jgi:hypothetical protein
MDERCSLDGRVEITFMRSMDAQDHHDQKTVSYLTFSLS